MSAACSLREKRILTVADVARLLGDQVAIDARRAGWLKPCVVKDNARNRRPFFRMEDLRAVEDRMSEGEYPGQRGRVLS